MKKQPCLHLNQRQHPSGSFLGLGVTFSQVLSILFIAAIAIAIERVITRYLSRVAKRAKLEPDTANNLALTFRIIILIAAVAAISRVGGFPSEWILSISAVGGAAVGFASQKTLGNFIAGLFLLAAKPFKVGDYVKIGTIEGIAQEITLNYAKILTSGNNTVSISNLQLLDRDVTNYLYESTEKGNLYCYTFEIGFDHSVPTENIAQIFETSFRKIRAHSPKEAVLHS